MVLTAHLQQTLVKQRVIYLMKLASMSSKGINTSS